MLAAWLAPPAPTFEGPVLVSAAISLTDALADIQKAYAASGGGPVRFNFGASNVLARQIANGAPADIFISADLAQMHYVEAAGAIAPGSSRPLVGNALAVVIPHGGRPLRDVRSLLAPAVRRIAIGDPAAVPAGFYTRQYLERVGLWHRLESKLLPLGNVRAALTAAESGGADAAIVYESDAAASRKVALAFIVPAADTPPIVYPLAVLSRSRNRPAAERFARFLQGAEAGEIFRRYRFSTPPTSPAAAR